MHTCVGGRNTPCPGNPIIACVTLWLAPWQPAATVERIIGLHHVHQVQHVCPDPGCNSGVTPTKLVRGVLPHGVIGCPAQGGDMDMSQGESCSVEVPWGRPVGPVALQAHHLVHIGVQALPQGHAGMAGPAGQALSRKLSVVSMEPRVSKRR